MDQRHNEREKLKMERRNKKKKEENEKMVHWMLNGALDVEWCLDIEWCIGC